MTRRTWRWRQLSRAIRSTGPRCVDCGQPADTLDHEIPLALGGLDSRANAVPRCKACNARKGARPPVRVQLEVTW